MEEVMRLEEKDAEEWEYREEGAANLVLAYTGSSPPFMGKIIRVHKVQRNGYKYDNGHTFLSKHERILWQGIGALIRAPTKEMAEHLYVQFVMIPLLGSEFVDPGIPVLVSREFLESVEKRYSASNLFGELMPPK